MADLSRRSVLQAHLSLALGLITARQGIAAAPPILGCYVGNPNGNDPREMAAFEQGFDKFSAALGSAPAFMNVFTDFSKDWDEWLPNARWSAWSWSRSSRTRNVTPVIGLPMATNADWARQPPTGTFRDIAAGRRDRVLSGIVEAWRDNGFKTLYLRPGYEMNATFMPWFMGRSADEVAAWTAAFARIAAVARGVGGVKARLVWNPVCINYTDADVASAYPGDAAVDVVGIDLYNNFWPLTLYSFAAGRTEPNISVWARDPVNRQHFWDYPSAREAEPEGQKTVGWGMVRALDFATKRGKPVAVCETGVGVNPDHPGHGIADEAMFPAYLAARLFAPKAPRVEFVNIWDVNVGDGGWRFSDGSKPKAQAAWRKTFGGMGARPA